MNNQKKAMMQISELVAVDYGRGGWRIHIRKTPKGRYKTTYPGSYVALMQKLVELRVGDCSQIAEILEIHKQTLEVVEQIAASEGLSTQLKIIGMNQSKGHADKTMPGWSVRALEIIRTCQLEEFIAEEIRDYAEAHGLPAPPDNSAWGGVIATAARLGYIANSGEYRKAKKPSAHLRPCIVWLNNNHKSELAA